MTFEEQLNHAVSFMRTNAAYEKGLQTPQNDQRAIYFGRVASVIEGLRARIRRVTEDRDELRDLLMRNMCKCSVGERCESCITTMKLFGSIA